MSESAIRSLHDGFTSIGADEGTLWLVDEERTVLVPVWNSGPNAARFVGQHRQPLTEGLISVVCATGQTLCETAVYRNAAQDPTLDRRLSVSTCAMIAVPFRPDGEVIGVVSCVKLKPTDSTSPDPAPFTVADLKAIALTVENFESRSRAS